MTAPLDARAEDVRRHLDLRTVVALTAVAVAVSHLVYAPLLSLPVLLLANITLVFLALLDRDKAFFLLLLAMMVLVDERSAIHHPVEQTPAFFGLRTDYPVLGLSPLQVSVVTAGLFFLLKLLRGCRIRILDGKIASMLGILVIGGLAGLRNILEGAKYFASSVIPLIAFVSMVMVLRARDRSEEWWADLLSWLWALFTAKAAAYVILLLTGQFHITTAANVRVFGSSLFAPVVLLGILLLLVRRRKHCGASYVRDSILVTVLLVAAVGQLALYFQRGQTIFAVIGLLFVWGLSGRRHTMAVAEAAAIGLLLAIMAAPFVVDFYRRASLLEPGKLGERVQREIETIPQLNILAREVESVRATEWRNIMGRNLDTFGGLGLFIGQGFGGFFTDEFAAFPRRLTPADYPADQRAQGRFYEPHSFFNVAALHAGLIGLVLYGIFGVSLIVTCRRSAWHCKGGGLENQLIPVWTYIPALSISVMISTAPAMLLGILTVAMESVAWRSSRR